MKTNETMMQYFEWYLPNDGFWWKRCAAQAESLKQLGITSVWLPPAYKAISQDDVGYAVYDMYDLGEFDQKGTVRTKYGTKKEYLDAISAFHEAGIKVYADIVLNHRMSGDEAENVKAVVDSREDRNVQIGDEQTIRTYSRFTFPGRQGKYSSFTWNHTHFTGTDRDENSDRTDLIYRFTGKEWAKDTDPEFGNFDYLMGLNVDMDNPEVVHEIQKWILWYIKTTGVDGLRLDAVKHIGFGFYKNFLAKLRKETGQDIPAVGEYWSGDLSRLLYYLDSVDNEMSLFDVALHYRFYEASTSGDQYCMRQIFDNTLISDRPDHSVTFVDNHDTQFGQSLQSFVDPWFKPLAYAMILLRDKGLPCVFYSDYYGNPVKKLSPVPNLAKLVKLRDAYAYGEQVDYLDDDHLIGWVRRGDSEHKHSGLAVILTNGEGGTKHMEMGKAYAGASFFDVLANCPEEIVLDENGAADFRTEGGNVSVWADRAVLEDVTVNS